MSAIGIIDLSDVVSDPDLCQTFGISRSVGSFVQGGWQETRIELTAYGIVTVASDRALKMVPEGDRAQGAMAFYTVTPLFVSHPNKTPGTSDILTWHNQKYRILSVSPQSDYGYYQATAQRLAGQ
jgi:hypothetical protein